MRPGAVDHASPRASSPETLSPHLFFRLTPDHPQAPGPVVFSLGSLGLGFLVLVARQARPAIPDALRPRHGFTLFPGRRIH